MKGNDGIHQEANTYGGDQDNVPLDKSVVEGEGKV